MVRQRSNTLPKSFGSQLEKEDDKKQDLSDKSAKPAVEVTLDSIQKKLQEKRTETNRPEDIKVQYMQIRFRPFKYKHRTHGCTISCESLVIFYILSRSLQPLLPRLIVLASFPLPLVSVFLFSTALLLLNGIVFFFWFSQIPCNSSELLLCPKAFGKFWIFQWFSILVHRFSSRSFQRWILLSQGILSLLFWVSHCAQLVPVISEGYQRRGLCVWYC